MNNLLPNYQAPPSGEPQYKEIPPDRGITPRGLAEALAAAAVCLVMALAVISLPVLDIVAELLFPLPLIMLALRQGFSNAVAGWLLLLIGSSLLFHPANGILLSIQFGGVGLVLGYAFRKGWKPLHSYGGTVFIAALGAVAGVAASLLVSGMPLSTLTDAVNGIADQYEQLLTSTGIANTLVAQGIDPATVVESMRETVLRLLPAGIIVSSMLIASLCYLVAVKILRKLKYRIERMPRFRDWRLDWRISWGLILGLAAYLLGHYQSVAWLSTVGSNLIYVFGTVMAVCGMAFQVWAWRERMIPLLTIFLFVLLVLISVRYAIWFCIILAVLDPLLDLRGKLTELRRKQSEQ